MQPRYRVLLMLFVCVVINYMDRATISIAGGALRDEFGFTPVQLGVIFSAFGWTYAALQIPGGMIADLVRPRVLYAWSLITWSAATLLQGACTGVASLISCRLAVGTFEAPAYPINNRIVTAWFPEHERASAIAGYTSGQYVGLAFLTPAMAAMQHWLGWRGLFMVTGALGIFWGLFWYARYRDPVAEDSTNQPPPARRDSGARLVDVLRHRKLWGLYLGQFCVASATWFFLTWFPTYLEKYRGISLLRAGMWSSVPFLAAFVGILVSGNLSDWLVRRGVSTGVARKAPVITGLLLTSSIIGANYVEKPAHVIAFLALAFFGNGMASITWVFVSLMAPKHVIGLTGGVFNFCGNLSAIVVPLTVGYLVQGGDFSPAMIFVGSLALVGIASYVFLVGSVERIKTT
jgi:ACS family D-galactonate transporter-like MFS transporter